MKLQNASGYFDETRLTLNISLLLHETINKRCTITCMYEVIPIRYISAGTDSA